jgi:hypothetical protein
MREMRDRVVSGEASGDLLGVALLFRAIGEAGLNAPDARGAVGQWPTTSAASGLPSRGRVTALRQRQGW